MAIRFVKYNQKKIAYTSEGRGVVVVFLHGFCEDSSIWDEFKLDLLEKKHRVVCIDFPGFGKSEAVKDLSIPYMVGTVQAVVERLSLKKMILIGHSMGGYVGLAYAKKYPAILQGLGLFHSHPYADTTEIKAHRFRSIEFIEEYGHALYVKQLFPSLFPKDYERTNRFLIDKLTFKAAGNSAETIIEALKAMANRCDESSVLKDIQVPVLFIIGEEDNLISMAKSMRQTALPETSAVHVLDKVSHMGMFEAKKKTQILLRQFVSFCSL